MKSLVAKRWKKEKGDVPLYQQVASFIAAAINSGDLSLNYTLPGHRQLAKMFGVGIQTVLHAMYILHSARLIKVSERSRAVVFQKNPDSPDWDSFLGSGSYDLRGQNFFSIADTHKYSLNLSMGLDKDYYLRDMFNKVMPKLHMPVDMPVSPLGLPPLREKIGEYMGEFGFNPSINQVMLVPSITLALNTLFLGLAGRNTVLVLAKPCHLQISKLVSTTGALIAEVPMDENGIMPYKLAKTLDKHPQSILCISPDCNVPTGTITSAKRREEIMSVCSQFRTPIIEHTVFPLGCTLHALPPLKAMDEKHMVAHISQVGVNASTNPWLGWIIADEYLLQRLNIIRFNLDAHQNYMAQMAMLEVLRYGHYKNTLKHMEDTRKKRQAAVAGLLEKYLSPYASWNKDNLDACVWLSFNKNINVRKLYDDAVEITFQPGWFYGEQFTNCIYLSPFTLSTAQFEQGLRAMVNILRH